jgi:arylsulfatase A-like enzyme
VLADLGFDDMGFRMELNGQPAQINTKNVDKLAREGVVLDAYYVQCVCSPSRVTFLT